MRILNNIEASDYHNGKLWLTPPPAGHTAAIPAPRVSTYTFVTVNSEEAHVDLALKLDVLAVFAVFAFVGAILLGAF